MTAPNVFIRQASIAYNNHMLFNNLNLTLTAGQWTCLLGPSGVGKSTLLRIIANLITPHTKFTGEIDSDSSHLLSSQISYMAQTDLLLPWLSVLENALLSHRLKKQIKPDNIQQAKKLLTEVGLEKAINKLPHELSGGMRQRAALVRTLLQDKNIILMDEPFSALDAVTRFQLQTLTAELLRNRTVLLVTHDPMEALRLANKIYILSGSPAVLSSPLELTSPTPRDPSDPELIQHQADLFHALVQAKEASK